MRRDRECLLGVESMSALETHVSDSESETYLKARLVLWIQLLLQVLPVRCFLLGVNILLAVFQKIRYRRNLSEGPLGPIVPVAPVAPVAPDGPVLPAGRELKVS